MVSCTAAAAAVVLHTTTTAAAAAALCGDAALQLRAHAGDAAHEFVPPHLQLPRHLHGPQPRFLLTQLVVQPASLALVQHLLLLRWQPRHKLCKRLPVHVHDCVAGEQQAALWCSAARVGARRARIVAVVVEAVAVIEAEAVVVVVVEAVVEVVVVLAAVGGGGGGGVHGMHTCHNSRRQCCCWWCCC